MDSLIEVQRQTHEEIERFERALYTLLSRPLPTHESQLKNAHTAAQILTRIDGRVESLNALYLDEDARKTEIELLSGGKPGDDLGEFYQRLKKIQEHYLKYPAALSIGGGFELELGAILEEGNEAGEDYDEYDQPDPVSLLFSGEEAYGKYLDLSVNHAAYCNLKNIGKRPGYLQYLDILLRAKNVPVHSELSKETRFSKYYETYVKVLHTYLLSFLKRTEPLTDVDEQQRDAENDFNVKWAAGEIEGWDDGNPEANRNGKGDGSIWCSACQKHYSKQTVYDAHLTSKKHIKATQKQAMTEPPPPNPNGSSSTAATLGHQNSTKFRHRTSALLTHLSTSLLAGLSATLTETKSNVERRFSLTAREREQELLDQQSKPAATPANKTADGAGAEEEEEEEEERIYNPLKLPLGWDGKPIPYWLYKLHGLGVEYRCEICSDQVYMGRKNFDRHFQESRHAFGMRALGLPNTKHFHEITRIEDALSLAERLKQEGRHEIFEQETMEELEDDEGNVYNRKTYEDLKKQGLI